MMCSALPFNHIKELLIINFYFFLPDEIRLIREVTFQ